MSVSEARVQARTQSAPEIRTTNGRVAREPNAGKAAVSNRHSAGDPRRTGDRRSTPPAAGNSSVASTATRAVRSSKRGTSIFSLTVVAFIAAGWWQRNEFWYTAERGIGYAFGIVGASLMALLLLYPLRKHWRVMRNAFPIRHWFRIHMMFGILGPTLVLFHANFRFGSTNSTVALICMLLVAGSGIVGRYVYRQIHQGLYGEKIRFSDLRTAFEKGKAHMVSNRLVDAEMEQRLRSIEGTLSDRGTSLARNMVARLRLGALKSSSRRKYRRELSRALGGDQPDTAAAHEIRVAYASWINNLASLGRLSRFAFFARLFSLWHVLHLPIFFMMLITAIVHIVVVHMY